MASPEEGSHGGGPDGRTDGGRKGEAGWRKGRGRARPDLANFHTTQRYARGRPPPTASVGRSRSRRNNGGHRSGGGMAARQEVFKRELYVQGACRFIVHQGATACDETFCNDPDSAPDWDDVIQVGIFHRGEQACPICLEALGNRSPQTTPCAHVFCFTCILKHLMLKAGENAPTPCPLCFTTVRAQDLRPASLRPLPTRRPGERVQVRLLVRERGRVIPKEVPDEGFREKPEEVAFEWPRSSIPNSWNPFCKVSVAERVEEFAKQDVEALERQAYDLAGDAEGQDELAYIHAALELVRQRSLNWANRQALSLGLEPPNPEHFAPGSLGPTLAELEQPRSREEWDDDDEVAVVGRIEEDEHVAGEMNDDEHLPKAPRAGSKVSTVGKPAIAREEDRGEAEKRWFFYYWHCQGAPMTLHPVNIRCLLSAYGSYAAFPSYLEAPILELEEACMDQKTRKRMRHLGHLPLAMPFFLAELDLSNLLPEHALDANADDLAKRRERREERAKRERAENERIRREQSAPLRPSGPSMAELQAMPAPGVSPSSSSSPPPPPEGPQPASPPSAGVSFASVAGRGFAAEAHSPALPTHGNQGGDSGESSGVPSRKSLKHKPKSSKGVTFTIAGSSSTTRR